MITAIVIGLAIAGQSATLPLPAEARAPDAAPRVQLAEAQPVATAREEQRAGRPLVCLNETVTGSRFPVRRCRPADLTPQERAAAADQLRKMQAVAQEFE